MKKLLLILFTGMSLCSFGQTDHIINAIGNVWSPNSLTIDVGDSVTFINQNQGQHNLNGTTATFPSNPESFSMLTTGSTWTYGHRFNIAGTYNYRCNVHSSMMTGTITVVGGAGLEENEAGFTAYPNPVNDIITLKVNASDYAVVVYDLLGNKVLTKSMSMQNQLDLSSLNSGTYLLEINVNGVIETQRIIKK